MNRGKKNKEYDRAKEQNKRMRLEIGMKKEREKKERKERKINEKGCLAMIEQR